MPIDPNIPLQAGQGVTPNMATANPLQTLSQLQGLATAQNYNKLLQANTANTQQNTAINAQGLGVAHFQRLGGVAASLAALPRVDAQGNPIDPVLRANMQHDAAAAAISGEVNAGTITAQNGQQWLDQLAAAKTPQDTDQMLIGFAQRTLPPNLQIQQAQGIPSTLNIGSSVLAGATNPNGGAFTPATSLRMGLTPGEQNDVKQIPQLGPDGKPTGGVTFATGAQVAAANGNGALLPGGGNSSANTQQQPPTSAFPSTYTGRSVPMPAPQPGKLGSTLQPGQASSLEAEAQGSVKAANDLYAAADAATGKQAMYSNMLTDLARMSSTGPGTDREAALNAFTQKYAGLGITMSKDDLSSTEAFAKLSRQIALAQAGALGGSTDQKLTTSMGANPNVDLSKLGNAQILSILQGNEDAIRAKAAAWNQARAQGVSPGAYNQWQTQFNQNFDPRAFQLKYLAQTMTPQQRKAYIDAMPDKGASLRKALINMQPLIQQVQSGG
jgi:hypothetical protein